ncbi:SDR family NAD(P)-dependent oxidoreductase [Tabrizicola oligotrophica]|uniref:SDR family NAD(P)-dependent oxidoreductase n=1 Tax=Tabrizicola oligotrophica TaxID=2710650 RepID=A0A6M0QRK1_9RHOB|nr:SDR family NAD(P)-dependent oxidoreductase [Tabrizicola oligotrophica]NEY90077.1 SDR family NAD(P)-dependent oxidoreductase [Tabrizicola oligotrophica]
MKLGKDMSAVITGGASGLGLAVAQALAARGVRTGILDRDETAGWAVAADLGGSFARCDVSDPASVAAGLAELRAANGPERICVNCAGIAPAIRTVSRDGAHDPAGFAKVIGINLIGTFNVASQSAAAMAALDPLDGDGERGVIVNTASIAAWDGQIGQAAYAASKAGVAGLTLPMARDLARSGIRVMAIAPGIFSTAMVTGFAPEVQAALAQHAQFPPRLGRPEEFAALVCHIAENPMLNGEVIRLDAATRMPPK